MKLKKVLGELFKSINRPIKTIIICDPGLDDLLMLLQILSSPDYEIVGIIPVYGNAKTYYTVQNTVNLCEFLDKTNIPIYPGSGYDSNEPDQDKKTAVYGQQGLGSVSLPVAKKIKPQNINGIEFALTALTREPNLLISTASTTEVAKILIQLSSIALKNIISISMMGAVINPTQEANWPIVGTDQYKEINSKQVTEANLGFDPQSSKTVFDICAENNVPILLAPLDLTHSILASESDLDIIKNAVNNPVSDLVIKLIAAVPNHYQLRYRQGPDGRFRQPLHDVHASSCLMHPEIYSGHWVSIEMRDTLPQQCIITNNKSGNIFLLDMHYMNRHDYFEALAADLKHYDYLSLNKKKENLPSVNANLMKNNSLFTEQKQTVDKPHSASPQLTTSPSQLTSKL